MIEVYTEATVNPHTISIAPEEMRLPYQMYVLELGKRKQKGPRHLKTNSIRSRDKGLRFDRPMSLESEAAHHVR